MEQSVRIDQVDPFHALQIASEVAGIWGAASEVSDEETLAFVRGTYPKHVRWPGFRIFLATIEGYSLGFVYGYTSLPGQWWHDEIAPAMNAAGYAEWLSDSLELAEIAVLPRFQGRGIGGRLIDAFLQDVHQRILLAVEATDTRAHGLYTSRGFHDLLTDFHYAGFPQDRIIVMGRPYP